MNTIPTSHGNGGALGRLLRRPLFWVLSIGSVVVIAAIGVGWQRAGAGDGRGEALTFTVERGPLVIDITGKGTISNRDQEIIKSEVEGRNTILKLVPEGQVVAQGDLLVELDASKLEESRVQQEITLQNAEASYIRARENLAITKSQAASDIAQAELDLRFAKLDLQKYVEGEFPRQKMAAENKITIAEEQLKRAREKLQWSQDLEAKGYLTRTELDADRLEVTSKDLDLKLARQELEVLEKFTYERETAKLNSDVEQMEQALQRVKRKSSAEVVQAEAEFRAREAEYKQQKDRMDKLVEQIDKCRMFAPRGGMVVYATSADRRWWRRGEPLEEGQEVREGQELIHLPTTSGMSIDVNVHESNLQKVAVGQPVRITVEALPGRQFTGKVTKIAPLPDAQSVWMNPDLKVYQTQIEIDGNAKELRTGMSCRAEIIVARHEDALFVPVQSVIRVGGKPTVYVVGSDGPKPRTIEIGLDNNRMVHVLKGLATGEEVLMAPPLGQADREAPQRREGRPSTRPGRRDDEGPGTTRPTTRPGREDRRPEGRSGRGGGRRLRSSGG